MNLLRQSLRIFLLEMILLLLYQACTYQPPPKERFIFPENRERILTPDSLEWCAVTRHELETIYDRIALGYIGSFHAYHLIRHYEKVAYYENQCTRFALPHKEFTPQHEFRYVDRDSVAMQYQIQELFTTYK